MAGRGVHRARARVEFDVLSADERGIAGEERMADCRADQRRARRTAEPFGFGSGCARENVGREIVGQQQQLVAAAIDAVARFGLERDRDVGGQRPGRRRPDHYRERQSGRAGHVRALHESVALRFARGEAHVDRGRLAFLIFDLGFGQRRLVADAPKRRAQTLVELLRFRQVGERLDDDGFVFFVDRAIGVLVVAEQAHT